MGKKTIELLLVETVENLGIVGDIVNVKPGYARNYLVPYGSAEPPTKRRIDELQERRKQVQEELRLIRSAREELQARMMEVEISVVRSCNDQGALYGSVSPRDISGALQEAGYDVGVRSIRLGQPIKRVGLYTVPIQFAKDLRTEITLHVEPDHPIGEEREEMEFDNEGNLIHRRSEPAKQTADKEPPVNAAPKNEAHVTPISPPEA